MEATAVGSDTTVNATSRTQVLNNTESPDSPPVLRLRLKKPKGDKKVGWREGTVDNEHMGKKKSKCCCIYKKPVAFGESSSEDDEECEHCFGHPEKRKKNRKNGEGNNDYTNEHDHDHECNEHEHDESATCSIHRKDSHQSEPTSVSE